VDPLTHGLASYALKRGCFPRASRAVTLAMLLAGTIADIDWLSYSFGPQAFLRWHRTYLSSLFSAVILSLLLAASVYFSSKFAATIKFSFTLIAGPVCAALLRILMDATQSGGVELFWPFRQTRVALDWVPNFDPWILVILIAAILLPELFLLVSREIGAKTKRPRGRAGALAGLTLLVFYVGTRAALHTNAVALLQSGTYESESPRRVAALPDSVSLFTWHGIVETASALHLLDVSLIPGAFFNPDGALNIHKPESSPELKSAQNTEVAQQFLNFARFPKATIEKETTEDRTTGYLVELHDLRFAAIGQSVGAIQAEINLDAAGKVTFAELEWEKRKVAR
jgi:inner membrane protein